MSMKPNTPNFAHVEGRVVSVRRNPNAGGEGVTNLTLEVPAGYKDYTLKIDVVGWHSDTKVPDGIAEGDYVVAEGRISLRSYESKKEPGRKIFVTEIVAESIEAPRHKKASTQQKPIPRAQPRTQPGEDVDDIPF
jgi:single-stranded DNA-binding protein